MRKKFLKSKMLGMFAVLLFLFMAAGVAEEDRTDASGQWTYVLKGGGATITGYTAEELTGKLTIPSELDRYPVTGIGGDAFARCESLTDVLIPEGVTQIGDAAFYWCFSLTSVIIPDSVTSIGEWSFKECFSLESVTIGNGVTSIGGYAFFGCETLTFVTIADGVTSIGEYAFAHCYSLTDATIPASVTDIGESAFFDCEELVLTVQDTSYAEQYAEENGLRLASGEARAQPGALADLHVLEDWDTGAVLGAAQSAEGTLLTGLSEYWGDGWAAFIDNEGNELWSLEEGEAAYLSPLALPNGGFAVLCRRDTGGETDGGSVSASLMILDRKGAVVASPPVPLQTRHIAASGDSIFALGNQEPEEGGDSFLTRFNSKGETLWTQTYFLSESDELRFEKAVFAEESLIICADAGIAETGAGIGMLYRFDLNGNIIWSVECSSDVGGESSIHDVCVNDEGTIALLCGEYIYDEEYGEPLDRICDVFGLNMDGAVLWNHKMDGVMADCILPVQGGFLCASQGLGLYNCPYLGEGWVLLLDPEGNVTAESSTPDIGGGSYEVYGMAKGVSGEALLYGTLLDGPGFPGAPFVGRLAFPEAY